MSQLNDKETLRNKLFISYGTIAGFVIFALVMTIFIALEVTNSNPFTDRVTSALLGITIIVFLFGIIIDQLKYRDFRFWALGAIVSFIGVILLFSPVVFYGLGIDDALIWIFSIVIGILLILFGYTIEAYELNNKVAKILINLWENIKNFEWKKIPRKILQLFSTIISGIAFYIVLGFKRFKYVIKKSIGGLLSFIGTSFRQIAKLIISLPGYFKKFVIFCYEYNYFLIIPLFAFAVFKIYDLPYPAILIFILAILVMLLTFMALMQSNEELSQRYLRIMRNKSWEALQSISIRIQKTTSSIGRYKCQNCKAPLKLGQEHCEYCSQEIKHCSICKLPIKNDQDISTCNHCQYPAHTSHWNQWISMNKNCPICHQ